jgi:LSD1 subclass zinc finger protein
LFNFIAVETDVFILSLFCFILFCSVSPPSSAASSAPSQQAAQGRCGNCKVVFTFPAGASKVRCGSCNMINTIPNELQSKTPTNRAPSNVTKAKCGSCQTVLQVPGGKPVVRCGVCGVLVKVQEQASHESSARDVPIPYTDIIVSKEICSTPCSVVFEANYMKQRVACVQRKPKAPPFASVTKLRSVKNPRLVRVLGWTDHPPHDSLVTEYSPLGALADVLAKEATNIGAQVQIFTFQIASFQNVNVRLHLFAQVRLGIAGQISEAMEYLEAQHAVHGSLNPNAVMVWEYHASAIANNSVKVGVSNRRQFRICTQHSL